MVHVPANDVFDILNGHEMSELKSKIKIKKTEPKEGNAFTGALAKAKEDGDDSFSVDGKEFDVEEEKHCYECGGGMSSMEEENEVCEKCGQEMCECGSMYESKKSVRLTEAELVNLISQMVNEAVPGLTTFEKAHKESGSQNDQALSDVEKKIKQY